MIKQNNEKKKNQFDYSIFLSAASFLFLFLADRIPAWTSLLKRKIKNSQIGAH